ncbi:hypothetical protein LJC43_01590 [Parabacteroides sp. OttesenSCG-928-G21]|nr:hypothetical protein [Parabacteroides sp. OttesenSCG-928-G21]
MRKIDEILLKNQGTVLNKNEMKNISKENQCAYSTHWSSDTIICAASPTEAETAAGPDGWWCCNCADAYKCIDNPSKD